MKASNTTGTPSATFRDAHLAAIVVQSLDAIVSKDVNGIVLSWNESAERIFGWSADEMIGKSIRLIIPVDRNDEEDVILTRIRAGEMVGRFETVRRTKDGREIDVAVTVSPLKGSDGTIVGASKIASDITETRRLRESLEASELQFRTLANSIPQLAWIADGQGYVFWYNDRWYQYTGTTLEQMRGWGWTSVHHPDHVERVKNRIQQSWNTGEEWEDTFPLKGKDGAYRWFLSRAKPVVGTDGQVYGWFGTNTDITAQRDYEQKLHLLMAEVGHRAKNMISVVQALVSRTADKKYAVDLTNRLQALSRNQEILTKRNWIDAPIGELIRSQLTFVEDVIGSRIFLDGDLNFLVSPSAAETIGLAIHELMTNSVKYGAMSNSEGTVHISCAISGEGEGRRLQISWGERGGPPVTKPIRTGFGTVMIERNPRFSIQADVELQYPSSGLVWHLSAPLKYCAKMGPPTDV